MMLRRCSWVLLHLVPVVWLGWLVGVPQRVWQRRAYWRKQVRATGYDLRVAAWDGQRVSGAVFALLDVLMYGVVTVGVGILLALGVGILLALIWMGIRDWRAAPAHTSGHWGTCPQDKRVTVTPEGQLVCVAAVSTEPAYTTPTIPVNPAGQVVGIADDKSRARGFFTREDLTPLTNKRITPDSGQVVGVPDDTSGHCYNMRPGESIMAEGVSCGRVESSEPLVYGPAYDPEKWAWVRVPRAMFNGNGGFSAGDTCGVVLRHVHDGQYRPPAITYGAECPRGMPVHVPQ